MKTWHLHFLGCVSLGLFPTLALAEVLTLEQAVQTARTHNPELRAAWERIEAARGRLAQARLWPNPELELSSEDFAPDAGGFDSALNLVGVTQTVPFRGKKVLERRIGRQEVTAAEAGLRIRERELVRDVTIAFHRVVAAQQKTAVSLELVDLTRSLVEAARKRVASGAAADQEQLRAEIEHERAEIELSTTRCELTEARHALTRLLGQTDGELGAVQGELRVTSIAAALDVNHPQLAAAAAEREHAELQWRRARLEPWPDITLGVAGGRDRAANETLLEFRVSLPLPLWDRAQGRRQEARALGAIARCDQTAAAQRLAQEWAVAAARVQTAQAQVDAYRTRVLPKAEEALRLVRGGFEAGKFGFLDLVDMQRTAIDVRLDYNDRLLELNTALADLEALAGCQE